LTENNKRVSRKVEVTITSQYLMANFKTTAEEFHQKILQHWRIETYAVNVVRKCPRGTYHLDMLMEEDNHIAHKEPFSIAILRNFSVNLYQLFLNANKDKKVLRYKVALNSISSFENKGFIIFLIPCPAFGSLSISIS